MAAQSEEQQVCERRIQEDAILEGQRMLVERERAAEARERALDERERELEERSQELEDRARNVLASERSLEDLRNAAEELASNLETRERGLLEREQRLGEREAPAEIPQVVSEPATKHNSSLPGGSGDPGGRSAGSGLFNSGGGGAAPNAEPRSPPESSQPAEKGYPSLFGPSVPKSILFGAGPEDDSGAASSGTFNAGSGGAAGSAKPPRFSGDDNPPAANGHPSLFGTSVAQSTLFGVGGSDGMVAVGSRSGDSRGDDAARSAEPSFHSVECNPPAKKAYPSLFGDFNGGPGPALPTSLDDGSDDNDDNVEDYATHRAQSSGKLPDAVCSLEPEDQRGLALAAVQQASNTAAQLRTQHEQRRFEPDLTEMRIQPEADICKATSTASQIRGQIERRERFETPERIDGHDSHAVEIEQASNSAGKLRLQFEGAQQKQVSNESARGLAKTCKLRETFAQADREPEERRTPSKKSLQDLLKDDQEKHAAS